MRLIIAEDEALLREGLIRLLAGEGHEVVAAVGTAPELVAKAVELRPDLVVTDIRMPPDHSRDGIEAALELRRQIPDLGVLVLSQHVDSVGAAELLADGGRGIGYLLKQRIVDLDPFLRAIDVVSGGGTVIDPSVVESMINRHRRVNLVERLSPRRMETLALMAEGLSNARIADKLVVTEKAVARNISAIFDTLGLPPSPDDHRRVLAVIRYLERDQD